MWDEPLALHDDPIRGVEIFDDKRGAALQATRMLATDASFGQAEKILRMASEYRLIRQRKILPVVKSLKHFQTRHSLSRSLLSWASCRAGS